MTKKRDEIIIQGSNDGQIWESYEFKYKPGKLNRIPAYVAPHQPRLDWQMWFAALSNINRNPWLINTAIRLLQGKKEVLKLFDYNPFPDKAPKYIRAIVYRYRFPSLEEFHETGNYWKRSDKRIYFPAASLKN